MQIVPRWTEPVVGPSGELVERAAVPIMGTSDWWQWQPIHEPWAGAFQQGYEPDRNNRVLAFSAVYACVTLRANDIAKLRIKLMEFDKKDSIWTEVESSSFSPVLRKPNRYQTRIQFLAQWITSKLLQGNTYILKERDARKVVTNLYVLDPRLVSPLITEDGAVYYQIGADPLSGVQRDLPAVPASEIIHDRMLTPYHPLCGVSPIYACGMSATQGSRIQQNSNKHFGNQSKPGGILTTPHKIDNAQAQMLKDQVEAGTSGINAGRLLVIGGGVTYTPVAMSAVDSQLIEQLGWTVEDVARAFLMPVSKLAVSSAAASAKSSAQEDLFYYKQTLQRDIEDIELLLDEGLGLGPGYGNLYGTEIDLEGLLRMDPATRATVHKELVGAALMKPNEGRKQWDLPPVDGGDECYLQQQNFSLAALAKRDSRADPFASGTKPEVPPPPSAEPTKSLTTRSLADELAMELEYV